MTSMDADDIIHDFMKAKAEALEQQIQQKGKLLDLFMDINDNNEDGIVSDQIAIITTDLDALIKELLELRKDSEFVSSATKGVIDRMGNIKPISSERLIENIKGKYLWQE